MNSAGEQGSFTWAQGFSDDCSQRICSSSCMEWCAFFPPPTPPDFVVFDNGDRQAADYTPIIFAVVGIIALVFVSICVYSFASKLRRREIGGRTNGNESSRTRNRSTAPPSQAATSGLDESTIRSIKALKYKIGGRFKSVTDCSVCLSEFHEGDFLRLLPSCNHAFHALCIDKWLMSQANCPLCRESISPEVVVFANTYPVPEVDEEQMAAFDLESGFGEGVGSKNSSFHEEDHPNLDVIVHRNQVASMEDSSSSSSSPMSCASTPSSSC